MDEFVTGYLELIASFLRAIDTAISKRLLRRVPPHEVTLTDELLARFDRASRIRETPEEEHRFQTEVRALWARFGRERPKEPKALDFSIEMFNHGRGFEGKVSNVDIGLLIETGERGKREYSRSLYLLQAKRLKHKFDDDLNPNFNLSSKFNSFDTEQHLAMLYYEKLLNIDAFRYLYYMPGRSRIDQSYPGSDAQQCMDGCGLWIGRVMDRMTIDPAGIYEARRKNTIPLMAVILAHAARSAGDRETASILLGRAGTDVGHTAGSGEADDLAYALVSGDQELIAGLLSRLGIGPVAYAPVPRTVLRLKLPAPAPAPRPTGSPRAGMSRGFR